MYNGNLATVVNPNQWSYAKWFKGEEISIRQYNRIVSVYIETMKLEIIEQSCKATNTIAVSAALLTRRQREKYKEKKARVGRYTYYYFDKNNVPLDVLEAIDWADDRLVFTKND